MSIYISKLSSELFKKHCAEWESLCTNEIRRWRKLVKMHTIDRLKLNMRRRNHMLEAAVTNKHALEIKELNMINQKDRIMLSDKQFTENNPN